MATISASADIEIVQEPEPVHAPLQLAKRKPAVARAVSTTPAPASNGAEQLASQSMPTGDDATCPAPATSTFSAKRIVTPPSVPPGVGAGIGLLPAPLPADPPSDGIADPPSPAEAALGDPRPTRTRLPAWGGLHALPPCHADGMNPAAGVEKRKVPRKLYDTLRAEEVPLLLAALKPHWRPVFATAVWTGLRKGELLGLRKSDVDMVAGTIAVRRSYDADTTKGGHADLIPIAAGLRPYLAEAMLSARGEYVFPDAEGRCKNCKPFDGTISATEVASAGRSAQPRVKTVRSPVRNESAAARRSSRVQPGPRTHR